jgi:ATP-binding cassette subfamily B multidrug efflux pump
LIRRLARYVGRYKAIVYAAPVVVLVDVAFELTIPLLMARIVDVGIANQDVAYIARMGAYMVLLALAAMVLGIVHMRLATVGSMGFGANLRDALFSRVQRFSFTNIDHFSTASLVTRLTNDVNNLQLTFMMALRLLLRAPMMLVVSFFMAYSIHAGLSVMIAAAVAILTVSVSAIVRTATRRFRIVQERIDDMNLMLQENLIGQRVVKAFVRADFETQKFQAVNDALTRAFVRAVSVIILNMPTMMLIVYGATIAIMWRGGQMVFAGTLGAGELISFLSYVAMVLRSIMMISMVFTMWARAQASGRRVLEVLDAKLDIVGPALPPQVPAPQVTSGKVEFRDVSFKYGRSGTGEAALSQINFTAEPGEVVAVVGGTGSGKSTLVNLIPRLHDVTAGVVWVGGRDVRDYPLDTLRNAIGVVLQRNRLFSGTIRENLLWGREDASQAEIETACRDAQAHDFILSFPQGYDTELGQAGVNLSGGQKQRLCIARALLKRPKILILDDSTSSVDSDTEARIRESFDQHLAGTTVFIIAQRISSVRHADKIVVLDAGRVIGLGSHESLLATNSVYQEINQSQQEGSLGA